MRTLIAALVRHRLATVIAFALLTAVAASFATRVRFDNSIEMWFLAGDPELVAYERLSDQFGGDEFALIGVAADDVFARPVLLAIERLSRDARAAPYVDDVRSLTTTVIGRPIEAWTDADLRALRERALASAAVRDLLVTADARVATVVVVLARAGNTVVGKAAMVAALRRAIASERRRSADIELFLSGTPVLDEALFRYNDRDTAIILPLTLLGVLGLGIAVFRRLSTALLPLAVVTVAIVWLFGVMGVLGMKSSILTSVLAPLLLAVGVADSVHVISECQRRTALGHSSRIDAVVGGVLHLLEPCTFTSITTGIGLLSLLISPMRPVREFGALAALGVAFAYCLSITLLPCLLAMLPAAPRGLAGASSAATPTPLLDWLGRQQPGGSRTVLVTSAILVVVSIWSIARLDVGVYALNWFPRDAEVVVDTLRFDRQLGGSSSLEFLVSATDGGLADPEVLGRLYAFERWLEQDVPGATKAFSIADVQRELPALPRLPGLTARGGKGMVELQYRAARAFDGPAMDRLVSGDNELGRITVRVRLDRSAALVRSFPAIEEKLRTDLNRDGLRIEMTGFARLMAKVEHYLLTSQIQSFVLAFGLITLTMAVLLRSWRLGLFAVLPNLVPIALGLGAMPVLGIGLDPGTVMIGAIALGLVVDDTVHLLVELRRQLRTVVGLEAAVAAAVATVGRPILFTSLMLMAGFGMLAFGSFLPNVHFGVVSAVVIGLALLGDLLLLPAALLVFRPSIRCREADPSADAP